jgi:hypothetical protein
MGFYQQLRTQMKSYLPFLLGALGVVGSGVAFAAFNAPAPFLSNQMPIHTIAEEDHEDRGHHEGPRFSAEDRAAFFEAHLAALHVGLKLTPDQEKFWPPLETAIKNGAKAVQALEEKTRAEPPKPPLADPIGFLQHRSEVETARGAALKQIADAAAPLYATLSDQQKHRLPFLVGQLVRPLHGSRWHEEHEGFEHEGSEHEGFAPHEHDGHEHPGPK